MGRPRQGWKLRKKPGERCWRVVFTHAGKQVERGTGQELEELAVAEAERIYAAAIAGQLPASRRRAKPAALVGRPLGEVAAQWLSEVDGTLLDSETAKTYGGYFSKHLGEFFGTVEMLSNYERARQYVAHRLRSVQGVTVRKELSAARGLLAWLYGEDAPPLPSVPKRAHGTPHRQGKRQSTELSPAEVRALLRAVDDRQLRAFFTLLYETTLRPATLRALSCPEHYRIGSAELHIPDGADKARAGRTVPLSQAAQKALQSVALAGPIFGPLPYRRAFQRAARAALGAKAATAHPYDLRRAGITHRLERTGNLPGVQYLAGHSNPATTGLYVRASFRAAEAVVLGRRRRSP